MTWTLLLLACTRGPAVTSADPGEVLAGTQLRVLGEGFAAGARVTLRGDDGAAVVLDEVEVRGPVLIEARVPPGAAPGTYAVQVDVGGRVAELAGGVAVVAPEPAAACEGAYTANTQLSVSQQLVVVDRFYKADDRRETLRIPFAEIRSVEIASTSLPDGRTCSAIYLRDKNGKRILFDDDTRTDLGPQAYRIANALGKPVVNP